MNKIKLTIILTLFTSLCTGIYGQITVGSGIDPNKGALLDIKENDEATGGVTARRGMMLPRVELLDLTRLTGGPDSSPVIKDVADSEPDISRHIGLTVYNLGNCPGVYVWTGTEWIKLGEPCNSPVVPPAPSDPNANVKSCIPYMFDYQTMTLSASYTATPVVTPSSYRWVVNDKLIEGATGDTYTYTPPRDMVWVTDALGNRTKTVAITCQMMIDGSLVQPSAAYEVLVVYAENGIGELSPVYVNALAPDGTALPKVTVAHVNLGAENDTDPCDCLGDLYQWGRIADGHQKRDSERWLTDDSSSESSPVSVDQLDSNGQVLATSGAYGKFIKNNSTGGLHYGTWSNDPKDDLWSSSVKTINDPCPVGWKVPSAPIWRSLYGVSLGSGDPNDALANTWRPLGRWGSADTRDRSGMLVGSALFLVAAGQRNMNDGVVSVPTWRRGYYWSASYSVSGSVRQGGGISITETYVNATAVTVRSAGNSVRCVADL